MAKFNKRTGQVIEYYWYDIFYDHANKKFDPPSMWLLAFYEVSESWNLPNWLDTWLLNYYWKRKRYEIKRT
jgi:hypothetical protein